MKYTMKLIFKKSADMIEMEERIRNICQRAGSVVLEIKDNTITYGAEVYEKFGPAFIHLRYEEEVTRQIIDAIWSSVHEGTYSCKKHLLRKFA